MPPKEKEKNAREDKNKKSVGNQKRQKIVKACKDCRRRKVKCDGASPCGTCKRSSIECIFESSTPKRGTSKQYFDSLESRIYVIERALKSLNGSTRQYVDEAIRRQQILEDYKDNPEEIEDRFMINEIGQASYVQDITSTLDKTYLYTEPPLMEEEAIQRHIHFYLNEIQPFFPLFVPNYFKHQYASKELPRILIYALCALASFYQQTQEDEFYYQRAILLLDEAVGRPSLGLIQALLLLIKYTECVNIYDKKYLISRTIEMCKVLDFMNSPDPANETKKRTLCMVWTYNVLLCVEQGIESDHYDLSSLLPTTLPGENSLECHRHIFQMGHTLSLIHSHLRRITHRQEIQNNMLSNEQVVEENMLILNLQSRIESDFMQLPSPFTYHHSGLFPAEDILVSIPPLVRLIHMIYHLNKLLLHFHYFKYPLPLVADIIPYLHRDLCTASASHLLRLVEGIKDQRRFQYTLRGLHFVNHCVSSALAVLHFEVTHKESSKIYVDEYQKCLLLSQRIHRYDLSHQLQDMSMIDSPVSSTSPSPIQPQPPTPTTPTHSYKPRRNTVSHNYHSLLHLSSTDLPVHQHHQPLHNIHSNPLNLTYPRLRAAHTQSYDDLRSLNNSHYKQTSPRPIPPGVPYSKPYSDITPLTTQSTGYRSIGKVRRVKKAQSSTQLNAQYTPYEDKRMDLHRPYEPSYDYSYADLFPLDDLQRTEGPLL